MPILVWPKTIKLRYCNVAVIPYELEHPATTIHELYVAGKDDVSTGRGFLLLPLLLEYLVQSDDMQLRSNAGECGLEENDETLNMTQKQYQQC